MMDERLKALYDEYLKLTGDKSAAASMTLADVMRSAEPAMLTVDEAALRLNLCTKKVYAMCRLGELPSVKVGRSVRIPMEEIERRSLARYLRKA